MENLCVERVTETLTVYQKNGVFRFGTDAFLLERMAEKAIDRRQNVKVCDLCSGTGIVGLLLCDRLPAVKVTMVEINEEAAALSAKSAEVNGLSERVDVCRMNLTDVKKRFVPESFGYVVCNPPYMKANCGKKGDDAAIAAARHEIYCTVKDVCAAAAFLLPTGGTFCVVYRTERLESLFAAMKAAKLAVKELCLVRTKPEDPECRLVLCRAVKGASEGMKTYVKTPEELLG